jgi:hypothetical protein
MSDEVIEEQVFPFPATWPIGLPYMRVGPLRQESFPTIGRGLWSFRATN